MLRNSVFCVHLPHQFPGASRARRCTPLSLFPGVCILSVFLSPHLRILDWILAWVGPLQFPEARMTASLLHRHFPDCLDCSDLSEGCSSHSTACATPDSWVSTSPSSKSWALILPSVNLHWKSFLVLFFDIGTLLLDRLREKIAEVVAREH